MASTAAGEHNRQSREDKLSAHDAMRVRQSAVCRRTSRDRIRRHCDTSLVWGLTSVGERAAPLGSRAPSLVPWNGTYARSGVDTSR